MRVDRTGPAEIWLEAEDGQLLCALISGERGWLMYLREPGDAGFSSRDPDYIGAPEDMLEFELDNGQTDYYPAGWTLPIEEIERALEYFEREQAPPPFVSWHDDSGEDVRLGEI